jgi:hypothetical protein
VCARSTIEGSPLLVVRMICDDPTEAEADSERIKALARGKGPASCRLSESKVRQGLALAGAPFGRIARGRRPPPPAAATTPAGIFSFNPRSARIRAWHSPW